ncbi:MAG: ABC transporter ATP-binding protein [Acidimicrobiales bacterium]|nr:ABC transporter ATP-binding protein [Acidimicrobiales bacterium]
MSITSSSTGRPADDLRPETASSSRFAWRVMASDRRAWTLAAAFWCSFFLLPLAAGVALKAVLDRIAPGADGGIWWIVAVLGGLEIGRWIVLLPAIVQWHGAWVGWHTVPRLNLLHSLVADPGPVTDRLPGSPGEAVSRLRDDVRDTAMVLDVWLDMLAALLAATIGLAVLLTISPPAAAAVLVPVIVVLWIAYALGERLRAWRLAERAATARVTGFVGDLFGGIGAVKVNAAEAAAVGRFEHLGDERAVAARRDQVGTQLSEALGGITSNAGIGLALLLTAPALRRGDIGVGDIGLFMTYAGVVASLPRMSVRWFTFQRQAEISTVRLGRLATGHDPDRASAKVQTHLRSGPPPFARVELPAPGLRQGDDRLERVAIRDLHVHLDDGHPVRGIDLDVGRGELVVVTGPVGSGKSVLLRAMLGLVPTSGGEIRWNGAIVEEPSTWFVPPRTAFVPQVPRLFSEPLVDTVLLGVADTDLERAFAMACLDEDLAEMPDGRLTMVGPKGVRLSGGQVQRTAAARAFVRRPELLVIDDLSSALDVRTETRVWDRLFEATGGNLTVIAVSHRPRVLARADQVVTLQDGRRH